jgi:asparagine synthase (glutamine-hydrolysing)
MCGIGGILSREKRNLYPIKTMMESQSHRGPDGEGYLIGNLPNQAHLNPPNATEFSGHWAIGHKRLAILDTSNHGKQPLEYANKKLWITYNGEIYNYKELKQTLNKLGYQFQTSTDTEVVLAAYQEWGLKSFEKLNGMWAMVIVDLFTGEMIFSRDRFGEKPLHYYQDNQCLIFSSEIKGILKVLDNKNISLNKSIARDYITWGTVNHTNETFFNEIKSFPAASYAIVKIDSPGAWEIKKYWAINPESQLKEIDFEAAKSSFKEIFLSSVTLRMRSDVSLGFCLSGGLDSSSIVCSSKLIDENLKIETFTAISDQKAYDERQWAEIVNNFVNARPNFINICEDGFLNSLDDLIWHQEEPFTTTSIYAQWLLMKQAKERKIPVILDGQGADEILCGYRKFYLFYIQDLLAKGKLLSAAKEIACLFMQGDRNIFKINDGLKYLPNFLQKGKKNNLNILNQNFVKLFHHNEKSLIFNQREDIAKKQINDLLHFSVPSLLRYEDRNSMAWSIEARVPFLDHNLVEFLLSLPTAYKMKNGKSKYIMREAFKSFVPESILNRRDKMGFLTAQELWMNNRLGKAIVSRFDSKESMVKEWINIKDLKNSLHTKDNSNLIFRLFILDKWLEKFNVSI